MAKKGIDTGIPAKRQLRAVREARDDQGERRRPQGAAHGAGADRGPGGGGALDLLTQRLDIREKNAWMLRSLLKK
jgi:hypothetical protein